jgi:uncharacterized protein with HEPN domain
MARRIDVMLKEVRETIDLVLAALAGVDETRFRADLFMQRGVERSLEVISEAIRHVPDAVLAKQPDIPWADIRGIGNRIRHEYWRVDAAIIWSVVRDDLPSLRVAIEALLADG